MSPQSLAAIILLGIPSGLIMSSSATVEQPEVSIVMTFSPDVIDKDAEVTFTIRATYTLSNLPVAGASVPIGFEKGSMPMSSMQMMGGMVNAREVEPGVYELRQIFTEAGHYIVHVHAIPPGRSMMDMMLNHADFGPLKVGSDGLQDQRSSGLRLPDPLYGAGILLLSSGLITLGIYRVRGVRWMKKLSVLLSASSAPILLLATLLVLPGQASTLSEVSESPSQAKVAILKGSYDLSVKESYSPNKITVVPDFNNTIMWSNQDISSHTITDDEGKFTSPLLNPGASWSYTFTKAGTYRYHCNPHPWMTGVVIVV